MKNKWLVLNILFGMYSVSLFSILFEMHYLKLNIKHFVANEFTDKFQGPESLSEFCE